MKQIGGGKDCVLTRGGLIEAPSTLGNLPSDGQLNNQKSAEAIVPSGLERVGRAEQLREDNILACSFCNDTDNPEGLAWRRKR